MRFIKKNKKYLKKMIGTIKTPRLCVFISNKHMLIQLIDDINSNTIYSRSSYDLEFNVFTILNKVIKILSDLITRQKGQKEIKYIKIDASLYKFCKRINKFFSRLKLI